MAASPGGAHYQDQSGRTLTLPRPVAYIVCVLGGAALILYVYGAFVLPNVRQTETLDQIAEIQKLAEQLKGAVKRGQDSDAHILAKIEECFLRQRPSPPHFAP